MGGACCGKGPAATPATDAGPLHRQPVIPGPDTLGPGPDTHAESGVGAGSGTESHATAGGTESPQRVVVYLGASQPVHGTHTRLVRALLDEGHDHVFLFLLRWRPERFGTTADAAAAQLHQWFERALTAAERDRLHVQVIQHDHQGAPAMRALLAHHAHPPTVQVCFSQKYADQTDRIERDWLPIYRDIFPTATPRFLTDDTDPGAVACGTAQFVESVQSFQLDGQSASSSAQLDLWRPEAESAEAWNTYVQSLLTGPLYTAAEKALLEAAFFCDSAMLAELDLSWRQNKVVGGIGRFVLDKCNWNKFWKEHATERDEQLFRDFVMRKQGLVPLSALEVLPKPTALGQDWAAAQGVVAADRRYVVLAAPAMHGMAERLVATDPTRFEYFVSKWRKFPDGTDNITLDTTLTQLHALNFLCESAFLSSLTIVLAYLPTGTMERYLQPGRVAAANTTAKMLSQLPACGAKRTRVMCYDIHAPPTQYFFTGSCAATLHTACSLVIDKINTMPTELRINCVAFPDDGAAKRFSRWFKKNLKGVEIVVCNKVRVGGGRVVVIADGSPTDKNVLIMDDLVQTGGTLGEAAATLKAAGAKTVNGFAVHAVFPNESWRRFLRTGDSGSFDHFWLSNSNPSVCGQIPSGDVFEILDLAPRIVRDLVQEPSGRADWS